MNYGVQLYSVRDAVKELGMHQTLCRVAELGYQSVEFAGFGNATAKEVRAWLDELGLAVDGAHLSLKALTEQFEQTLADLLAIGCTRAIVPAAKVANEEQLKVLTEGLNAAKARFAPYGIDVGFHNHAVEYLQNEDGVVPMQRILEDTDVFLELDTYWAYHAGIDPVAEMERLGKRLALIHIKDGDPSLSGECGKPLGMGTAPVSAVYQKALALGIPVVVESETLTPSGLDEIAVCIQHLKTLEQ